MVVAACLLATFEYVQRHNEQRVGEPVTKQCKSVRQLDQIDLLFDDKTACLSLFSHLYKQVLECLGLVTYTCW